MLSAHTESIILSALPAESIIVSAPPAESMILSAPPADTNTQARCVDDVSCLKIANKYIVKTIIFSSFNNMDLLCSMLANCCMW
jgi:hypothetical protein